MSVLLQFLGARQWETIVSQFLFLSATPKWHCIAWHQNCVANCDAIPLIGNTAIHSPDGNFCLLYHCRKPRNVCCFVV